MVGLVRHHALGFNKDSPIQFTLNSVINPGASGNFGLHAHQTVKNVPEFRNDQNSYSNIKYLKRRSSDIFLKLNVYQKLNLTVNKLFSIPMNVYHCSIS